MAESMYFFECPHCKCLIEVSKDQINCRIFRHGVFKSSLEQINPHSSKEECDEFVRKELIIGCGKPFRLTEDDPPVAVPCGYI